MARITKSEQAMFPGVEKMIAPSLVAELSQDELSDRCTHARNLLLKADAVADPVIRAEYKRIAGAALRMPHRREEIEKRVGDIRTKARLSWNKVDGARLEAAADRVLADNPIAPRRQQQLRSALRKAADAGQVACYDKDGNLVGIVDPAKVIPVVAANWRPGGAKAPAPADELNPVTKRRLTAAIVRRP